MKHLDRQSPCPHGTYISVEVWEIQIVTILKAVSATNALKNKERNKKQFRNGERQAGWRRAVWVDDFGEEIWMIEPKGRITQAGGIAGTRVWDEK